MSVSFVNATNFLAGTNPNSVTTADIDGDGKKDLVIANSDDNNVSVLLNDGSGGFGAPTNYTVGMSPSFVAVADFDGNSKLDFVVTNSIDNNVSVLLNNGSGGFGTPTNFAVGTNPNAVVVEDFDGDGKLDLVVANSDDNNISVLLNDGSGGFGTLTNFAVGTNPNAVAVADFDGDGKLDLVVANSDDNNVSVLLNDGSGGFGTPTNFAVGTNPRSVAVADFDGDGKLDLVVANSDDNNVSLLLNDGSGGFGAPTSFAVGTNPRSVAVADFDGDGKLDLVVANSDDNNVSLLLNDGSGGFGASTSFAVGTSPRSVAVEDFDGDGKLDLVVANSTDNNVSLLLNNSNFDPTDLMLSATSDDDDKTIIGLFTTTDPDQDDEHTYSLVAGTGDTDNNAFIIEGDSLKIKSDATKSSYKIRVRTTDLGGLSFEKELDVNIDSFGSTTNTQITTIFQLVNITQNIFIVNSKVKGKKGKLSLKIKNNNAKEVNELCVFAVDDEEGRIKGIAPGAEGYTRVALERSKVIFSSIAKLPKGFKNEDLKNILEFESGTKLRFYLVSNSTTEAVLSGKTSFSSVVFSSATNNNTEEEGFSLNFQDLVVTVQATEQEVSLGTGLQGKKQGELIDLRNVTQLVTAEFAVNREASYNNFVGFYQVADENGGIDTNGDGKADILVGQAGYAEAAVRKRVAGIDLAVDNQGTANYAGTFGPNSLFAPFIIVDGKPDAILNGNGNKKVYFSFLGANSDKVDHIRLLGNNTFGFEDLPNGGDKDYNDMIVQVKLSISAA
ncbi:FG-GAP-like repeat-containing protein [Nostoc punctiforme]|uniref:FG-GAP repeat protein n=1 Tax=Nostoc punctiforme (strain ATCC 29133 / PCC 73102) TaxID=63737 RepID=B2J0F4_NOSP7|nr:FG-GAP-like repeat-containing protein [Nostoc punctiforme]ACC84844.1 FG-GAP repeat protein [Nostoc punctiforme PCC 73102]